MNPSKIEDDLFHHLGPPPSHHGQFMGPHHAQSQPPIDVDPFSSLAEIDLLRADEDDDVSHTSSEAEIPLPRSNGDVLFQNPNLPNPELVNYNRRPVHHRRFCISPEPHISSQFYTFNKESHALMIKCLIEGRLATPEEIRAATPPPVLTSWRSVWKDRNEDTAYLTAWKRIQDKLTVHASETAASITGSMLLIQVLNRLLNSI